MYLKTHCLLCERFLVFPPSNTWNMKPTSAVAQHQKSSSQPPWHRASDPLWFSRAAFVCVSPSMTRAGDLIACYCRCSRYTLGDDSAGEQVRSQPIVTNGSEISRSTGNCVESLTLLFTKLAPRTSSVSNGARGESGDYRSQNRKKRGGDKPYCSCQDFILSVFLLYKCLAVCKHTHTKTRTHTHTHRHCKKYTPVGSHPQFLPVKDVGKSCQTFTKAKANLFIYLSSE